MCIVLLLQETLETVVPYLNDARVHINTVCAQLEAWQIILYTVGVTFILVSVYNFIFDEEKSKFISLTIPLYKSG